MHSSDDLQTAQRDLAKRLDGSNEEVREAIEAIVDLARDDDPLLDRETRERLRHKLLRIARKRSDKMLAPVCQAMQALGFSQNEVDEVLAEREEAREQAKQGSIAAERKRRRGEAVRRWIRPRLRWLLAFLVIALVFAVLSPIAWRSPGTYATVAASVLAVFFIAVLLFTRCPKCKRPLKREVVKMESAGSYNTSTTVKDVHGHNVSIQQTRTKFRYHYRCKACGHRWTR